MKRQILLIASVIAGSLLLTVNASGDIKNGFASKDKQNNEVVSACLPTSDAKLTPKMRQRIAKLLGWQQDNSVTLCQGYYLEPKLFSPAKQNSEPTQISANYVSFYNEGRSELKGDVTVIEPSRQVSADTATIYRNKNKEITQIELIGNVHLREQGRLIIANKAIVHPNDKSGLLYDIIYRIARNDTPIVSGNNERLTGLNAWGQASKIERFNNGDSQLDKATYSTCPPLRSEWKIQAKTINLDKANGKGVARNATIRVKDWPVFYTPYLSFPTDNRRKSGFLMPLVGYSNQSGFSVATPYYWNIAPNYDMVITPQIYSNRGLMMGSDFRYLTHHSSGELITTFLPQDRAYQNFLHDNQAQYPFLQNSSTNRWSVIWHNFTRFNSNFDFNADVQQVSDDYYLQDFTTNLAWTTENQLLRKAYLNYHDAHWLVRGGVMSYQTLHPINQSVTLDVYQRLPQLIANGSYADLPFNLFVNIDGEYDYFSWSNNQNLAPEGSRFHINPLIGANWANAWGYVRPVIQLQQNNYQLSQYGTTFMPYNGMNASFNTTIPQASLDSGLFFDRDFSLFGSSYSQTLEPRVFYLYVPYVQQYQIPSFDSGYYIFNFDQLTRTNRFSGIDRIADANQISYAVSTRLLSEQGIEKASISVGQIRYFRDRKVQLCFNANTPCFDNGSMLVDYSSPTANYSPIAAKFSYTLSAPWTAIANIAWDPDARRTTNSQASLNYYAPGNRILSFGYTYMVNGDTTVVARTPVQNNALNQLTFSYAWPYNEHWSSLGTYGYNISKRYDMTYLLGVQYDDCCWAARLIGGKVYRSINAQLQPDYTTSLYFQILLKGLGTVAISDPTKTIQTYIPGYQDTFKQNKI